MSSSVVWCLFFLISLVGLATRFLIVAAIAQPLQVSEVVTCATLIYRLNMVNHSRRCHLTPLCTLRA